jgi:hypothetical protein
MARITRHRCLLGRRGIPRMVDEHMWRIMFFRGVFAYEVPKFLLRLGFVAGGCGQIANQCSVSLGPLPLFRRPDPRQGQTAVQIDAPV